MNKFEEVHFTFSYLSNFMVVPILFFCLFISFYALKKLKDWQIFLFLSAISSIISLYLILNVDSSLRADALKIFQCANEFNRNNYNELRKGFYVANYPHQLGMITIERLLIKISNSPRIIFFANALSLIGINLFQWRTTNIIFKNNAAINKITIILSFLFIPQLFFVLFAYGLILGLFAFYISIYLTFKYFDTKKIIYSIISVFPFIISYLIKNNFLIGILAIVVLYIFHLLKFNSWKNLIFIVLITFTFFFASPTLSKIYERKSDMIIENQMPKSLYLAMGLQDDQSVTTYRGWYNGFHKKVFEEVKHQPVKANKIAKKEITKRIVYFAKKPVYSFDFFGGKVTSTWNDPMFQSVWSGPLESTGQFTKTKLLRNIYNGRFIYKYLNIFMNALVVIILSTTASFVLLDLIRIKKRETNVYIIFCSLYFIGGFIFHLFWETKSQYVYPYIFFLIPISASVLFVLFQQLFLLKRRFLIEKD
ncbi:MAG: hypothetical protein ACTIC2_10735 [Enterococcus devriesei]|uniref:hypothetical protein n=1 Tax=Enterococcus devriesei TaxID=319970 RepID=UPI003F91D174